MISAIMITSNEEARIAEALKSISWVDEIVVVDNFSGDRTCEISGQFTKHIYKRKFDDYSSQKNFALNRVSQPWILWIDADEIVTPELRTSIQNAIRSDAYSGYRMRRCNFLFGRELRFGGQGNDWHLRLFQRDGASFSGLVHEKVEIKGEIGMLEGNLIHKSTSNFKEYSEKLNRYVKLEVQSLNGRDNCPTLADIWIKPILRFIYIYFLQLGFLDGLAGLKFHFLSSYNMFLSYRKRRQSTK